MKKNQLKKEEQPKKKIKVVLGCYFCEKGFDVKDIAITKDGNVIQAESPKLKKYDNHFICKKCYQKVKNFFVFVEE